ncbi:Arc family DNA-binding protein [Shimia sagamensis]|uniref:Arc-like DNA binding domain-containing protein n=1 Tax=Shimia sagamensis TaxID=1566352 RepID=A0ABY1PIF7_9RHOB|nr:Arc family DNA-binding protein [Shimia sagamensis]SMP34307.1 Arc-like DNA binding domain-containing protein [Shimia sagamensis]
MIERKPQDLDKFIVRLPDGMRERIKVKAAQNNRNMNAEVVTAREEKFPEPELQHAFVFKRVLEVLNLPQGVQRAQLDELVAECAGFGIDLAVCDERQISFHLGNLTQGETS